MTIRDPRVMIGSVYVELRDIVAYQIYMYKLWVLLFQIQTFFFMYFHKSVADDDASGAWPL